MQHIYNTEPVHVLCNVHDYDYCASKSPDGFLHNIIWIMQALDSLETGGITTCKSYIHLTTNAAHLQHWTCACVM